MNPIQSQLLGMSRVAPAGKYSPSPDIAGSCLLKRAGHGEQLSLLRSLAALMLQPIIPANLATARESAWESYYSPPAFLLPKLSSCSNYAALVSLLC